MSEGEAPAAPWRGAAETLLLQSRILESMTEGVSVSDESGHILYTNPAEDRIFGYRSGELIGQHLSVQNGYPPEENLRRVAEVTRQLQTTGSWEGEWLNRKRDGTSFYTRARITSVEISGRKHWVRLQQDITERKQTEEALSARERESQRLLANLPDVIARFDRDLRFVFVSPAIQHTTGMPPEHFLGKTHLESGLPQDLSSMLEAKLRAIFETRQTLSLDFEFRSPHGLRHYSGVGVPEFTPGGGVESVLAIVHDATSRKRAEDAQKAVELELLLLVEASGSLLASPHSDDVLKTIITLGQRFVSADAHSVWRKDAVTGVWRLKRSSGLSEAYLKQGSAADLTGPELPGPLVFEDAQNAPFLAIRREALMAEGIQSMLTVPLRIQAEESGTVVFYWRTRRQVSETDIRVASALGNLAAAALGSAELYSRQQEATAAARRAEHRSAFLAGAGALLSSSLDYQTTLTNVAKLAVPALADWCSVDVIDEHGSVKRVAVEHADPEKIKFAYEFSRKYPPREDDVARIVLRTGKSLLAAEITDEMIEAGARDAEHVRLVRELGVTSLIIAPMVINGESLGIITLVSAESGRRYSEQDLQMAEELARRAATAVSHAHLYQDLRTNEERLRLAVEAAGVGVWERDLETGRVSASEQSKRNVGADPAVPLSLEDLRARIHDDDRERWQQAVQVAVEQCSTFQCEYRVRWPDGSQHWVLAYGRCLCSDDGRPRRLVGVTLDVTERKRSEEELRRANLDLNQFAYSASHDLQEPLRMVAIYSQLLWRQYADKLDPKAAEYIGYTVEGAKRMGMLVRDLLAYTQAANLPSTDVPVVDTNAVLEKALLNLKSRIDSSQAEVRTPPLPPLWINEVHLIQVFQNLIGNAIKYRRPEERPSIGIQCERSGEFWKFSVSDNGIGIPPGYLQQVFGLFKRLHSPDKYPGTGIGLAICQRIVERYGGRIWVESEEGAGSTFYFTLPGK